MGAIIEDMGDYPDGTELEVEILQNDEMSQEERAKLNASIERGIAECEAGLAIPAEVVLAELRARRCPQGTAYAAPLRK